VNVKGLAMHESDEPLLPPTQDELRALEQYGLSGIFAEDLVGPLRGLTKNLPQLSDHDIDRIAAKVASKIEEHLGPKNLPDPKSWKEAAANAIRDLIIGVLGSGLYALIVYLSTEIFHMDGPSGVPRADSKRESSVRSKLLHAFPEERRKDLESSFPIISEVFSQHFQKRWQGQIAAMAPFREMMGRVGYQPPRGLSGNPREAEVIQGIVFDELNEHICERMIGK
jgi:hypothetical protein